jgi:sugar/nucleoside kinase (ribokinase family)
MQVTAIGGATIDIVVTEAAGNDDAGAKRDVESITMGIGGGAVNASLAFHACDAQVRIVCALGGDAEAEWLRAALRREGIDLSLVQLVAGLPTGKAVIHLDANGDVRVFAQRGASTRVSPARALDAIGRSDLLYVTALSAEAEAEFDHALQRTTQRLPRLAFNPGMRQLQTASAALQRLLQRADLVSMNEAEVRLWASRQHPPLPDDLRQGDAPWMSTLRQHEHQAWLVTLGAKGALFHDGAQVHHIDALKIPVRSALGAGDAFGATLACHWAAGQRAPVALEAARAHCAKVLQVAAANLAR